jgi:hypothetical protein
MQAEQGEVDSLPLVLPQGQAEHLRAGDFDSWWEESLSQM